MGSKFLLVLDSVFTFISYIGSPYWVSFLLISGFPGFRFLLVPFLFLEIFLSDFHRLVLVIVLINFLL